MALGRMLLAVGIGLAGMAATALAAEPAALRPSMPVAPGIAAFPRLVAKPGDRAAARINRALAKAEGGLGCDDPKGQWHRTVAVTMRGPRYLSLVASDDYYCGGAYPDTDQVALVYDLATGAPVEWRHVFPAGMIDSEGSGTGGGDGDPVTIGSAALWTLYAKAALPASGDKQCAGVLADTATFGSGMMLWPDAEADGIAVVAASFPHVVKACGPPVILSAAALRKLGVEPAFLDAVATAHRNGWYDKTGK